MPNSKFKNTFLQISRAYGTPTAPSLKLNLANFDQTYKKNNNIYNTKFVSLNPP